MTQAPNFPPTPSRLQLEVAATELHRAATHADTAGDGEPFSPWTALAGQIRLVAAAIAIVTDATTPPTRPATDRAPSSGSPPSAAPAQPLRLAPRWTRDDEVNRTPGVATVVLRHLESSAVALRGIQPEGAPTDLAHWLAHLDDLARDVTALDDAPPDDGSAAVRTIEPRRPR